MRMSLARLRALVAEEVERNNRWSAGLFMSGGPPTSHRDREASPVSPPPGLGTDDSDEQDQLDATERFTQPGARAYNRDGGIG